jgi:O-antigen/teichoic acid export membrane protein
VGAALPSERRSPPGRGLSHERPLGISSSLVFLIGVLIQGIGFAGNYFIAHHIGIYYPGQTAIGVAGLFLTIASTINGLGDLRIGSAYTYFIARGRDPDELTGTYVTLRLGLVAAVSLALFALAPLFYFTQGASSCPPGAGCVPTISSGEEIAVFGLFLITPWLWSPGMVYSQLWIARGDSVRSQSPLLVQSVVQTIGLIAVALLAPPPAQALWGFAAAYLVGGVASALWSIRTVLRFSLRLRRAAARGMFVFAWPLMGGLMLAYVWTNAPAFFVATLGAGAVAIFLAANGFRILLLGLPAAVSVPLFPHLTNLHIRGEYEKLRRRTWAALRYTAMIVIPAAIAMIVYRGPLISTLFVATTYGSGAVPLAILAASAVPAAFSQIILTALTSVGRQRLDLYLAAVQVVVLLSISFLVLPPYAPLGELGIEGAAIAILVSSLAALAMNIYFMERILAVRLQPRPIGAIALSALVSFFVVGRLNTYLPPDRWYILVPAILLGFAAYYLVLAATGELSKQDVRALAGYLGLPSPIGRLLARFCWRAETRDAGELLTNGAGSPSDARLDATRGDQLVGEGRPPV